MPSNRATKPKTVFFSGYLDESLHRELKIEAEKADRSLIREVNFRLKQTIKPKKRRTLQVAE